MGDLLAGRRTVTADGLDAVTATLRREPASVPAARHLVRAAVVEWDLPELVDIVDSVASELATNAVLHTRRDSFRVTICRVADDLVQVAVVDFSRELPTLVAAGDEWENGRGLLLVEALSEKWGTEPLRWGKRVWADLAVPPAPEPPAPEIPIYSSHRSQVVYVLILLAVAGCVITALLTEP